MSRMNIEAEELTEVLATLHTKNENLQLQLEMPEGDLGHVVGDEKDDGGPEATLEYKIVNGLTPRWEDDGEIIKTSASLSFPSNPLSYHNARIPPTSSHSLRKEVIVGLVRVPCILNTDSINVTCDRCSSHFTSLSQFLAHLNNKRNQNKNLKSHKRKDSKRTSKSKQSILSKSSVVMTDNNKHRQSIRARNKRPFPLEFQESTAESETLSLHADIEMIEETETVAGQIFQIEPSNTSSLSAIKSLTCSLCDKSFRKPIDLKHHLQFRHSQPLEEDGEKIDDKAGETALVEDPTLATASSTTTTKMTDLTNNDRDSSIEQKVIGSKSESSSEDKDNLLNLTQELNENSDDSDTSLYPSKQGRVRKSEAKTKPKPKLKEHIKEDQKRGKKEKPSLICEVCGLKWPNSTRLKWHIATHSQDRTFICLHPGCTKTFKLAGHLSRHKLTHTNVRSKLCSECGKSFLTNGELKTHMLIHGERNIKCEECDFSTKFRSCLATHVQAKHSGHIFTCHVCGKNFKHKTTLKFHVNAHEKEKPYKCEEPGCTFAANHPSGLYEHRNKHLGIFRKHHKKKKEKKEQQQVHQSSNSDQLEDQGQEQQPPQQPQPEAEAEQPQQQPQPEAQQLQQQQEQQTPVANFTHFGSIFQVQAEFPQLIVSHTFFPIVTLSQQQQQQQEL